MLHRLWLADLEPLGVLDAQKMSSGTTALLSQLWYANGSQPGDVVLRRRSALRMVKGCPALPRAAWLGALRATCASPTFGSKGTAGVHVLFMVHSVEGMHPGLYILVRDPDDVQQLRNYSRGVGMADLRGFSDGDPELVRELEALESEGCFLLAVAAPIDVRGAAQLSACNQDVAGDGAFAAALVGRVAGWRHPHEYLELLWEAGTLGHILYLAAHAAGVGGTGLGCFFDDFTLGLMRDPGPIDAGSSTAQAFDVDTAQFQVLYHFAVGCPEADPRLLSFDPYHHLDEAYAYEPLPGGVGRIWRRA